MVRPMGIDLFAGVGGLSLGFEQAGFDIAAAVEIDPIHCAAHEFNFPRCATICRSVRDISADQIRSQANIGDKDIAVVFGGPPCQGFSTIGKRALDDPRNELVHHFVRLVIDLRPAYVVFENVKGLTVGKQRRFLDEMIQAFAPAYRILTPLRVLNAADYGVPQNRHRLFLMGARADQAIPAYPEFLSSRPTVGEAIGDLPDADDFAELLVSDSTRAAFGEPSPYSARLRGIEKDQTDFGYRRLFDDGVLTASMRTSHTPRSRFRFAETHCGATEPISRFRRLDPAGLCNTLRAGTASDRGAFTSPRPIHPTLPRVITNREAARLHSYPDWFRFHVTKWHGFRQIGNSVPPLLGNAVAREIARALDYSPHVPPAAISLGDPSLLALSMAEAADRYGVPSDVIPKRRRTSESRPNREPLAAAA